MRNRCQRQPPIALERQSSRLTEARANYLQAIPPYEAAGSRLEAPATLHELAGLEIDERHPDLACAYLELAIARLVGVPLIGARFTESRGLARLGDAWLARGDFERACVWYDIAYDTCQRVEFSTRRLRESLSLLNGLKNEGLVDGSGEGHSRLHYLWRWTKGRWIPPLRQINFLLSEALVPLNCEGFEFTIKPVRLLEEGCVSAPLIKGQLRSRNYCPQPSAQLR